MILSCCMPTRGRGKRAAEAVERLYESVSGHEFEMIVVSHPDDAVKHLAALNLPNFKLLIRHCTAIEGWNIAAGQSTGDWIKVWDDDLWPNKGWFDAVLEKWRSVGNPETAYFGLWDRNREVPKTLFTRAIGTRKFFTDICGGVLTIPVYRSWEDDREKFELAKRAGCAYYCPESIIDHRHPIYGHPTDDTYKLGATRHGNDRETFRQRKAAGFPKNYAPVLR